MTTLPFRPAYDVEGTLNVKKLDPNAVLPSRAKDGDAGYDCVAISNGEYNADKTYIEYKTGLSIEVPPGYHVELFPRSSISKYDLVLANSIGLVDNGYRGELLFRFKVIQRIVQDAGDRGSPYDPSSKPSRPSVFFPTPIIYQKGDKIGQIVIRKTVSFPVKEVEQLSQTERGTGGFGSSDKK